MNLLIETFLKHGAAYDAFGILGLILVGFSAIQLARKHRSWGGSMMACGAIALVATRIYVLLAPYYVTADVMDHLDAFGFMLITALPPLLLSFGLAGIVWGLWGHERWLSDASR